MKSSKRNASLDALRTLAITMVFVHHLLPHFEMGARGVDLFFVLSGYLIGGIVFSKYLKTGTIAPFSFWRDRWTRTLPAYYAALAAYILKDLVAGAGMGAFRLFAPYAVFTQSYVYAPDGLPRFHHSWSLAVEEHFYLVLPLILFVLAKLRKQRLVMPVILAIGLALFIGRIYMIHADVELQPKLTHWRTEALIIGLCIARVDQTVWFQDMLARARGTIVLWLILTLAFAAYIQTAHHRYFQLPIAIAFGTFVILGVARHPVLEIPGKHWAVAWIARISYSIYLVHPLILVEIAKRDLPARFGTVPGWAMVIVAGTALSLAASQLLYMGVERPGLALRERMRRRARERAARGANPDSEAAVSPPP